MGTISFREPKTLKNGLEPIESLSAYALGALKTSKHTSKLCANLKKKKKKKKIKRIPSNYLMKVTLVSFASDAPNIPFDYHTIFEYV